MTRPDKPVVHYDASMYAHIEIGVCATVFPIDHYSTDLVSNTKFVRTSIVEKYDRTTGVFETLNTKYVPTGG